MLIALLDLLRPLLDGMRDAPFLARFCMVILLGMLPGLENRTALFIAVALGILPPLPAFFAGAIGTISIVCVLVPGFEHLMTKLRGRFPRLDDRLDALLHRTRKEHSHRFNRFGAILLVLLTALPLPAAGAYTSVAVSYVFGVKPRYAVFVISLGVICAGILGLIVLDGVRTVWELL